ncbi:Cys-tRNA(Pro) deacylase [Marinobacter caseinilyticus]|uniref:Cys-tRNA(Pro) deacylase n=1 Tax=Marinobacter caseinilyticus TaxID=2692195 RepID=UPI0014091512|nr:Cys-tRNA(Pro) deacylase [Marinobacter caseinilyticus]
MTPAINAAKKAQIAHTVHEYQHDVASESYGLEAAEKLNLDPRQVFKTLVVSVDGSSLVVAVLPVSAMLSMKLIAKAVGGKKAVMAEKAAVQRSSGYVLGGISPLGQKKPLTTVIDVTAQSFDTVFVSAGRRGLEIELAPGALANLTRGQFADVQQP